MKYNRNQSDKDYTQLNMISWKPNEEPEKNAIPLNPSLASITNEASFLFSEVYYKQVGVTESHGDFNPINPLCTIPPGWSPECCQYTTLEKGWDALIHPNKLLLLLIGLANTWNTPPWECDRKTESQRNWREFAKRSNMTIRINSK